ncbi:MAG: phosphoribosylaminoimidazolesuccinocarboxamide synthase [Methanomassiliicoccaceae archaeon]|nr:phosphoribosylaminoimidazolesuccinocarboxamide synthase [Methanomassiliicoccaceae archaeon]
MKLIRKGKVKEVYQADGDTLEFVFSDNISVFDKIIPSSIPHKGETLCRTALHWFSLLEKIGIKGHLIEYLPPNGMRVKRFSIIEDYDKINTDTTNYLIPLEFICRHYVAGSLMDRISSGKVSPEALGFPKGHEVKYGEKLPRPYLETTTKLEEHDRELDEEEAKKIAGLTDEDYKGILDTILAIDKMIEEEAAKRGLIHVDGKKEFGYDEVRNLVVIDTFGTCDEDRWWDLGSYKDGEVVELSKEFVRQHYRETGYHAELSALREKGLPDIPIPPLPEDIVRRVTDLYAGMFERITGERFR